MAVYKIFPAADATIYSKYPAQNTGLDEILEVAVKNNENPANSLVESVPSSALLYDDLRRSILRFSNEDVSKIYSFVTSSWKAGLKLYLANADNLSVEYTIEARQISQSWDMGTGHFEDSPETRNGVCWYSTSSYASDTTSWATNPSQYYMTAGGGSWTGSYYGSQSFDYNSPKDLNVDVTSIVDSWFSGSQNNGILLKLTSSIENDPLSYIGLSFFSVDTHTVYPPTLEMKWDDSSYTGSLSEISDSNFVVSIGNNQGTYKMQTELVKFRINARDKYPTRAFTTSSVLSNQVSFVKKTYNTVSYQNAIETSFTEFVTASAAPTETGITVAQFFDYYNQLFYDIPVEGDVNSHTYLVQQSQQYIGASVVDIEKQALIEEINALRQQLLDLNQTFTTINNLM